MFGVAPNPDCNGSNWTVLIGSHADEDEDDPEVTVVALTSDTDDLPGVTEQEFRFSLYEDSNENPHAVYAGVQLHRHNEEGGDCELFRAEDGRTDLEDVPDDLRNALVDVMSMELRGPDEIPLDCKRVRESDLTEPDTDPRGFQ